jgi:hypothetical protein
MVTDTAIKTVETTTDYPYSYAAMNATWLAKTHIPPKIAAANYLLPF